MIDSNQLAHFRERQLLSLMDVCRHLAYSVILDDYNSPIPTWTEIDTDIPCGLEQLSGDEHGRSADTLTQYDAVIRLAISENWDVRDKIVVIKRYGEEITPITYQIVSPIQRGPSGIRMLVKKVDV